MKVLALAILVVLVGAAYSACHSSADCPAGQCCLSPAQMLGKRQIVNTCTPLGAVNAGCLVDNVYVSTIVYYGSCPCADGLYCHGSGMISVPLGESGSCAHH